LLKLADSLPPEHAFVALQDGSFWAGPDWVAPNDTICDTARPDSPFYAVLPQASFLRQKHIGQERSEFFTL
jgi:hypothetical protein